MADVFEKPAGWVETSQPAKNWNQKTYVRRVRLSSSSFLLVLTHLLIEVYYRGWEGVEASVFD